MKVVLATLLIWMMVMNVLSDDSISREKREVTDSPVANTTALTSHVASHNWGSQWGCSNPSGFLREVRIYQCPGTSTLLKRTCRRFRRGWGRRRVWRYRWRPGCPPVSPCGKPDDGTNTKLVPTDTNLAVEESYTYMCKDGFQNTGGNMVTTCQVDGKFTLTPPTCTGKVCGKPNDGTFTMLVPGGTSIVYPNSYTYQCMDGYMTTNPLQNKCQADGRFSLACLPVCLPKVCGPPPAVTGANAVVSGSLSVGQSFTYECMTGYSSTGGSLTVTCLATGLLSSSPTCTANMCTVPTLANGKTTQAPGNVAVGIRVDFTCVAGFRFAPSISPNPAEIQTLTCQNVGTFTAFTKTCVPTQAKSCKDYFIRDNQFPLFIDGICADVDIGAANKVQCCKNLTGLVITTIRQTSTKYKLPSSSCDATSTNVLPGVTFTKPPSAVCDSSDQAVTYVLTDAEIATAVRQIVTEGGMCLQRTIISCKNPVGLSLALKVHGQATGGALYGTDAFSSSQIGISSSGVINSGKSCDCGVGSSTDCPNGCKCTRADTAALTATDTITNTINPGSVVPGASNLKYVDSFRVTQHNSNSISPSTGDSFDVEVGPIQCHLSVNVV